MKHDFYNKYSFKIKSIQEVTKKIKSMAGKKKIILCHKRNWNQLELKTYSFIK